MATMWLLVLCGVTAVTAAPHTPGCPFDKDIVQGTLNYTTSVNEGSSVLSHLLVLRCCGFCRLRESTTRRRLLLHEMYRALTLTLTTVYLLQECVYAYQERSDMDKLSRVMFLLLCHITSIAKQLVFHLEADRIEQLIQMLDDPSYNQVSKSHQTLLLEASSWASRFVKAYASCAVVTCTLWIIFPIIYHIQGQTVEFPFWTHIHYTESYKFVLVLVYSYYVTTLVGIANTTMDAFMATVLGQCKTQLTILRMNFETLPTRARHILHQDSTLNYDKVVMKLFCECLDHYNKIVNTTKLLENIFGTAILIQFAIGGWILCMAAYKIVNLSVVSIEFASMVLFTSCILTELFLYCYYGNEVAVESERLVTSVYCMEWVGAGRRLQRSLLLVLRRAQRPLRPHTGRVIPLSLDTFLKIIKSSYTFYAVLRQTK